MKKTVEIEGNKYEIITDYREGYQKEDFLNRYTDYFKDYDYIVGDWAYGKLRLKGFYEDNNKKSNKTIDLSIIVCVFIFLASSILLTVFQYY